MQSRNGRSALQDRPITDLAQMLADETSRLVRLEVELAKHEMAVKREEVRRGTILAGVAAVAGLFALSALAASTVIALGLVLPLWAAVLVSVVPMALIAVLLGLQAKRQLARALTPSEHLVQGLKEDMAWLTRLPSAIR